MKYKYLDFKTSKQVKEGLERIKRMGSKVVLKKQLKNNEGKIYYKEWEVTKK